MRSDDRHPVTPGALESALAAGLSHGLPDVDHLVDRHVAAMVALGTEPQARAGSATRAPAFTTWLKLKAARLGATGVAALAATGGLAHAGELPAPIQDAVAVAAAPTGLAVPTAAEADRADADALAVEAGEPTADVPGPPGEVPAAAPDVGEPGEAPGPTDSEPDVRREHPANHGADVSAVAHGEHDDHGRRVSQAAAVNGRAHRHGAEGDTRGDHKGPKHGSGPKEEGGPKDDGREAGGRDAAEAPATGEAGHGRGNGARHDREQDARAQGRGPGSGKDRPGKGRSGKGT